MSIFSENDRVLKICRGDLYEVIKKTPLQEEEEKLQISHLIARDGSKYMVIENENNCIRLNSSYSPAHEADVWAEEYFENCILKRIITMYGLANGYFARELCKRMDDRTVLIIYEPSVKIFMDVIKEYDITDIVSNERVFLYVGKDAFIDFKEIYLSLIGVMSAPWSYEVRHTHYDCFMSEQYGLFCEDVLGYKASLIVSYNFMKKFGHITMNNMLFSISKMEGCDTIGNLKRKFEGGQSAIVISAGPSLMKNMHMIEKARGRAMIVATDAVVNKILEADIVPDVIFSIDPIKKWKGDNDACNEIPYICAYNVNKDMIVAHKAIRYYYSNLPSLAEVVRSFGRSDSSIDAGSSVATTAVSVCGELGFKNIILVGQDLAYGEDGRSHIDREEKEPNDNNIYVEGIDGNMLPSREDWVLFLRYYSDYCMRHPDIRLIDATQGGAKIQGTEIMTLEEAIDSYCTEEYDYKSVLEDTSTAVSHEEMKRIVSKFEDIKKTLMETLDELGPIKEEVTSLYDKEHKDSMWHSDEYKKMWSDFAHVSNVEFMQFLQQYIMVDAYTYFHDIYKGMESEEAMMNNHLKCIEGILDSMEQGIPEFVALIDKYMAEVSKGD